MAEQIVHLVEAAQVDHCQRTFGQAGILQPTVQQGESALTIGQAGERIVPGLVDDALLALGDTLLHRIEGLGQRGEFVGTGHVEARGILAAADPFGGKRQRADGAADAAADEERGAHGQQRGCQ